MLEDDLLMLLLLEVELGLLLDFVLDDDDDDEEEELFALDKDEEDDEDEEDLTGTEELLAGFLNSWLLGFLNSWLLELFVLELELLPLLLLLPFDVPAWLSFGILPFGSILCGAAVAGAVFVSFGPLLASSWRSLSLRSLASLALCLSSISFFSFNVKRRSGSFFFGTTTETATGSCCFFSASFSKAWKSIGGGGAFRFFILIFLSSSSRLFRSSSSARLSASGSYNGFDELLYVRATLTLLGLEVDVDVWVLVLVWLFFSSISLVMAAFTRSFVPERSLRD